MSTIVSIGVVPEFTMGDRLRKARELTGLDRKQFAETIGIHRDSVAKYEAEGCTRKPVLESWARHTHVRIEWLENGDAPQPSGPEGNLSRLGESNSRPSHYKGDPHNITKLFPTPAPQVDLPRPIAA